MEYKITKEQIIELNNTSSGKTQGLLRKWFPDVFGPKFEIGKWYTIKGFKLLLVCYQGGKFGFGFNSSGYWDESKIWTFETCPNAWVECELTDILEALTKETKKRYTTNGFVCLMTKDNVSNFLYNTFEYSSSNDMLTIDGHVCYSKGVWAEAIKPTIELTIDDIAERFGISASQIKIKK